MKKIFLTIMILCLPGLIGCQKPAEPVNAPAPTDSPVSVEREFKKHETSTDIDTEGCNKIGEYSLDFDRDDEEDLVELFTSAEIVDGEIFGDDRNRWILTVATNEGTYKLYDEYIQLGEVQVEVGEFYNEDTDTAVIMTITSNAGKSITHYIFKDDVFVEEMVYSTDEFSQNGASILTTIR